MNMQILEIARLLKKRAVEKKENCLLINTEAKC